MTDADVPHEGVLATLVHVELDVLERAVLHAPVPAAEQPPVSAA